MGGRAGTGWICVDQSGARLDVKVMGGEVNNLASALLQFSSPSADTAVVSCEYGWPGRARLCDSLPLLTSTD